MLVPFGNMTASLPLAGIRVLDLSRVLAGPFATMLLGDLGADVWKLEPPAGDETRAWGPPFWGDPADGRSAYFASVNRNKRSLVVDLRTDDGERSDLNIRGELGRRVDHRPRVNHPQPPAAPPGFCTSGATIISAEATSSPSTSATVLKRQMPLKVRCSSALRMS